MNILAFGILTFALSLQDPNWLDLTTVLTWIVGGGGATAIVMAGLSLLAENWPAWHSLRREVKFVVPWVAAILLSFAAQWLLAQQSLVLDLAPWWAQIVTITMSWLASQGVYMQAKKIGYATKIKPWPEGNG